MVRMNTGMFLGVDVGTTSIKAGLFGTVGRKLEFFAARYPTQRNKDGWVEQDPDSWVEHFRQTVSNFSASRDLSNLSAIGIPSQVNTHVFVGSDTSALVTHVGVLIRGLLDNGLTQISADNASK